MVGWLARYAATGPHRRMVREPRRGRARRPFDGLWLNRPMPAPRDTVLDAARFLAITPVVLGHAFEPLLDAAPARVGYLWIYAFHMPLFALLSGHLTRDLAVTDRRAARLLTGVVLPSLVFGTAYSLVAAALSGRRPMISPLDPYWVMWFLFARALWRAALGSTTACGCPRSARRRWPSSPAPGWPPGSWRRPSRSTGSTGGAATPRSARVGRPPGVRGCCCSRPGSR